MSAAERDFRRLLESEHIPKAGALLASIFDRAMVGDIQAAALFFKVCGLIRRPNDDAAIRTLAEQLVDGMVHEARVRRASEAQSQGRSADLGTEE
ncbi:MAG TPA: hypothetical protein VHO67_10475 [Polyangia bacterium]|nr:hypothetical protein [Polyangia bacterium]